MALRHLRYAPVVGALAVTLSLSGCAVPGGRTTAMSGGRALLGSIPAESGPTLLSVAPDGTRVYAASKGKLLAIDTASHEVVSTVQLEPHPSGLAVSPDGRYVYVNHLFAGTMTVVDTVQGKAVQSLPLATGRIRGGWARIAVSNDGQEAYTTNRDNEALGIATLSSRTLQPVLLDIRPRDVVFSPDGRFAYICGCKGFCSDGSVRVYDRERRRFTKTLPSGVNPYRMTISPDGARLYTANLGSQSVSAIDPVAGEVLATIPVPNSPTGLFLSADGARLYVSSNDTGEVVAIDTMNNSAIGRVRVGRRAREVVATPDGRHVYVSTEDAVVVLDARALTDTTATAP